MYKSGVYCINHKNKYYKIGVSKDVDNRIKAMQTSNPIELSIEFYYECNNAYDIERRCHNLFSHLRVRGEWFELSHNDLHRAYEFVVKHADTCRIHRPVYRVLNNPDKRNTKEEMVMMVYEEMLDYGHIASKSMLDKEEDVWVIKDIQNGLKYRLFDVDKWVDEDYSVDQAIFDLGLVHKA